MKKVLFVATVVKTHIMEFHLPYLKMFKEKGWETWVVAKNDYTNPSDCCIPYCDHYVDMPFDRSPFSTSNIAVYKDLKKLCNEEKFDIVHCHTPVGGVVGRLAASKIRKNGSKVFYTAHGFHFYKGSSKINWMLYYPVEWFMSFKTDTLITITREDYARAKKHFHAKHIEYVPGVGVDLAKFKRTTLDEATKRDFKHSLGIAEDAKVVLSVGELNKNKNHQVVINALSKLRNTNVAYLIAGCGVLDEELKALIAELGLQDRVKLLGYRSDIPDLLSIADIYCQPSFREGVSVAIMEAMGYELPVICSECRGNVDLIEKVDDISPYLNPYDIDATAGVIEKIINDADICSRFGNHNLQKVQSFSLDAVMESMIQYYDI